MGEQVALVLIGPAILATTQEGQADHHVGTSEKPGLAAIENIIIAAQIEIVGRTQALPGDVIIGFVDDVGAPGQLIGRDAEIEIGRGPIDGCRLVDNIRLYITDPVEAGSSMAKADQLTMARPRRLRHRTDRLIPQMRLQRSRQKEVGPRVAAFGVIRRHITPLSPGNWLPKSIAESNAQQAELRNFCQILIQIRKDQAAWASASSLSARNRRQGGMLRHSSSSLTWPNSGSIRRRT